MASTSKMCVDGGQSDGQNMGMFPLGLHHDDEVQGNATGSMDTLVGPVPSHNGVLVVVHWVISPMAILRQCQRSWWRRAGVRGTTRRLQLPKCTWMVGS